jgi:hypothetical protein
MNILCRIFGHKSNENVYSGAEYMRIFSAQVDLPVASAPPAPSSDPK